MSGKDLLGKRSPGSGSSSSCEESAELPKKKPRKLLPDLTRSDSNSSSGDSSIPDGTIPDETSQWNGYMLPSLRIFVDPTIENPFEIFQTAYLAFLKNEQKTLSHVISFFREDHNIKMKQCFQRLCSEAFELDYNRFEDVPFQKVLELRNKLKSESWLSRHDFPVGYGIQENLKRLYMQLLYMVRKKNMQQEVPEGMFCELFMSFVKIFGLEVHGFEDKSKFEYSIGDFPVTSKPDALICNSAFQDFEKGDVIAVVEVKKYYSRDGNCHSVRTQQVPHVNDHLKAQHIGEMLALLPHSVFEKNGLYGFIVQGTNVTVVSFKPDEDYYESLKKGKPNKKNAYVQYSRECNILSKEGRAFLSDVLFDMAKLSEFLCERRFRFVLDADDNEVYERCMYYAKHLSIGPCLSLMGDGTVCETELTRLGLEVIKLFSVLSVFVLIAREF